MLELDDIKKYHDKAAASGSTTRERAANDLVFYWVTQWDDAFLADSQLAYMGEFDILRKAGRGIMSDLQANPVQVDFEPKDENRDDAADLLDGLYRSSTNDNQSIEAFSNASNEGVVCGVAAWELYTEYATMQVDDNNQVIKRRPLYEANNTVFFDPNSKSLDKADANYVSVLASYSEDGYKELVKDLTGEELDTINVESFSCPEQSYSFPWIEGEGKKIYVVSFYHREKVKDKILTMINPIGQELNLRESELKDVMDDLLDDGYEIIAEKEVERWKITKYIASGAEVLDTQVIAGQHIPIVPYYGERAIIEGEEHYEGITRLAKDPQRLRNFQMSYLADIVSRSPRAKNIYLKDQIAGYEDMYADVGAESNYPYLLQNRVDGSGIDLPLGPAGRTPDPTIPPALIGSIELSRQAVDDVASPGLPQDVVDPDSSGKAIYAIQNRIDMQSMVYQEHMKHAKRRDGEIYASMASEIYDVPRDITITKPDGTRTKAKVMETAIDSETGEIVVLNDINNQEFNVYSDIGPSYSSRKEQTVDKLMRMIPMLDPGDPVRKALMLKLTMLVDGVDFDDIREYANIQLVLSGIKKPETPEEEQALAEAQQAGQQPSAEMVLARAEMVKGEAAKEKNQIEVMKVQSGAQNEQMKRMIDEFKAATERMNIQIEAQEAGATIDMKRVDTFGKQLDNQAKIIELQTPNLKVMTEEELYRQIQAG